MTFTFLQSILTSIYIIDCLPGMERTMRVAITENDARTDYLNVSFDGYKNALCTGHHAHLATTAPGRARGFLQPSARGLQGMELERHHRAAMKQRVFLA